MDEIRKRQTMDEIREQMWRSVDPRKVLKMLKDARIEGDSVILSNTSPPSLPGTRQAP